MISVVIPTHNRPEELKRAIKSVFNQTKLPQELIVVDDASRERLNMDIFSNAPLNLICNLITIEHSNGGNHARNIGIDNANGDYIALLDDDDIFEINKIELISTSILENPNVDVFYHKANIFMVNENYTYTTKPEFVKNDILFLNKLLIKNIIGGTPMVIFKKEGFIKSGKFHINIPALQDYELWLRFAKNGLSFMYIDQLLTTCFYTTKNNSISKSINAHNLAIEYIEKLYRNEYDNFSVESKKEHKYWKARVLIHKYLLNEQKYIAIAVAIYNFRKSWDLRVLGFGLVILFGKKIIKFLKKNSL